MNRRYGVEDENRHKISVRDENDKTRIGTWNC